MPAADFARARLFRPIGIADDRWEWPANDEGDSYGGGGLVFHARDMARFGELLLQEGRWNGRDVAPPDYVRDATEVRVPFPKDTLEPYGTGYGYQLWTEPDAFFAIGAGGHTIGVYPELDVVLVTKALDEDFAELRALTDELVASVAD